MLSFLKSYVQGGRPYDLQGMEVKWPNRPSGRFYLTNPNMMCSAIVRRDDGKILSPVVKCGKLHLSTDSPILNERTWKPSSESTFSIVRRIDGLYMVGEVNEFYFKEGEWSKLGKNGPEWKPLIGKPPAI